MANVEYIPMDELPDDIAANWGELHKKIGDSSVSKFIDNVAEEFDTFMFMKEGEEDSPIIVEE